MNIYSVKINVNFMLNLYDRKLNYLTNLKCDILFRFHYKTFNNKKSFIVKIITSDNSITKFILFSYKNLR